MKFRKNVQSGHLYFAWLKLNLKSSLRISEKGVGCYGMLSAIGTESASDLEITWSLAVLQNNDDAVVFW